MTHLKAVTTRSTAATRICTVGYRDIEQTLLLKNRAGGDQRLDASLKLQLNSQGGDIASDLQQFVQQLPDDDALTMEQFLRLPHELEAIFGSTGNRSELRFFYPLSHELFGDGCDTGFIIERCDGHSVVTVELDLPLGPAVPFGADDCLDTAPPCRLCLSVQLKTFLWLEDLLDLIDRCANEALAEQVNSSAGQCPLHCSRLLQQLAARLTANRRVAHFRLEAHELEPDSQITRFATLTS